MRGRLIVAVAGAAAAFVMASASAVAHHSFAAEYDGNKPITLRGTVVRMEWINPHAWIHLDVKNTDGSVTRWMIEGAAPNALIRRGWNKNSLPPGIEISVDGYLAKDGSKMANGREMTLSDGRRLFAGSSGIGAPYEGQVPQGGR
jgi:hypothetical protein